MNTQAQPSAEKEVLLLIKRRGIDQTWQVAPYPITSQIGAVRMVQWLRKTLPPFDYKVTFA